MNKEELFEKLNRGILEERLKTFERNLMRNIPRIQLSGGVGRIVDHFFGKHVVVVGAGPSLEEHIPVLKRYQHHRDVVMLCTDMALLPLVKRGIKPGFVISCETVPVDFFGLVDTHDMHLLAFSCISPLNLLRWKGDVSFYNWMIHKPPYTDLWHRAGKELGFVATGNTVTTQAVSFALGCRVESLIIAGNDLGFMRQYYLRGTVTHHGYGWRNDRFSGMETLEQAAIRNRRDYILKRGEDTYYTSHQFLAAKLWLEDLLPEYRTRVYDASIPGCSENAVEKIGLKKYLDKLDTRSRKRR